MEKTKKTIFKKEGIKMIESYDNLYFGQQHIGTIDFFGKNYHTIKIDDFPHYKYLHGNIDIYRKYLHNTWKYTDKSERNITIENKINSFRALFYDVDKNGIKEKIKIVKRFDGKDIICGGNHRSAIGCFLNIPIPFNRINIFDRIKELIQIEGKFGLRGTTKPYHSIYKYVSNEFVEIIQGRRRDLLERINLIDKEDIVNKNILDIGCNIGTSSFLAAFLGAKKVVGIDNNVDILNAAIRLNTLFALPCYFKILNLNLNKNFKINKYNTAFIFSVDKHIKNHDNLVKIIKNNIKIVYFETHENSDMPLKIKKCFSKIKLIETYSKRKLYKCIVEN